MPFNKTGLLVNPNTACVNRKLITSGSSASKFSYHKTRNKSRCSSAIAIFRKACFISDIKPIFPKRNRNKILQTAGNKHGPEYRQSFNDGSSLTFEDAETQFLLSLYLCFHPPQLYAANNEPHLGHNVFGRFLRSLI